MSAAAAVARAPPESPPTSRIGIGSTSKPELGLRTMTEKPPTTAAASAFMSRSMPSGTASGPAWAKSLTSTWSRAPISSGEPGRAYPMRRNSWWLQAPRSGGRLELRCAFCSVPSALCAAPVSDFVSTSRWMLIALRSAAKPSRRLTIWGRRRGASSARVSIASSPRPIAVSVSRSRKRAAPTAWRSAACPSRTPRCRGLHVRAGLGVAADQRVAQRAGLVARAHERLDHRGGRIAVREEERVRGGEPSRASRPGARGSPSGRSWPW